MAKDTEEIDDVVDTGADTGDKPQTVRESIMAARDEVAEKNDDKTDTNERTDKVDDGEQGKTKRTAKSTRKESDSKSDEQVLRKEKKEESSELHDEEIENKEDSVEETDKKPAVKTKAPVGWTKEAKAKWDELPPEIQDSVLKREKEVADGFAGTKQHQERLQRYDAVIQPRLQQIQAFGVTPEQTIDKLFQWMEVLSHQNEGVRYQGFKTLAENFKIDLNKFAPQQQTQEPNSQQQTTQQPVQSVVDSQPPQWAQSLIERQQQTEQQLANQRQSSAQDFVMSWAKDKTHYEKVKPVMVGLLQSGAIPLKNGQLDLDAAYNKAVRMDDEVWETIQQEKQDAEAEKAKETAAKKQAEVAKAKKASASIRPSAPTGNLNGSRTPAPRTNGSKPQSARDSIMAAIREANEA